MFGIAVLPIWLIRFIGKASRFASRNFFSLENCFFHFALGLTKAMGKQFP